jgi:hypothetical protein
MPEAELTAQAKAKVSPWKTLEPYASRFIHDMNKCMPAFSEHWKDDQILSMSFESICKNRTDAWGTVHPELAISYGEYLFTFLGINHSTGETAGVYVPHAALDQTHVGHLPQPYSFRVTDSSQLHDIMNDMDKVLEGSMSEEEFRSTYGIAAGVHIDWEGFCLLRKVGQGRYSYSKLKGPSYYASHKYHPKRSAYLLGLSDLAAKVFPMVALLKDFHKTSKFTLACFLAKVRDSTASRQDELLDAFTDEGGRKAFIGFLKGKDVNDPENVQKRFKMLSKLSPKWAPMVSDLFHSEFNIAVHEKTSSAFDDILLELVMTVAPWQLTDEEIGEKLADVLNLGTMNLLSGIFNYVIRASNTCLE